MRFETKMHINPPTATAQHKGERVVFKGKKPMVMHYMKKPQRIVHDNYIRLLKEEINNRTDGLGVYKMFTTPIIVEIDFMFAHTSNTAKRDQNKWFARSARPDLDNMAKGLLDCLTEVELIQDDGLIFDLRLRKFNVPLSKRGIRISITDELDTYTTDGEKENANNG